LDTQQQAKFVSEVILDFRFGFKYPTNQQLRRILTFLSNSFIPLPRYAHIPTNVNEDVVLFTSFTSEEVYGEDEVREKQPSIEEISLEDPVGGGQIYGFCDRNSCV